MHSAVQRYSHLATTPVIYKIIIIKKKKKQIDQKLWMIQETVGQAFSKIWIQLIKIYKVKIVFNICPLLVCLAVKGMQQNIIKAELKKNIDLSFVIITVGNINF